MYALPTRLAAARLALITERPYLAAALMALQPVPRPGIGTMGVDRWWRLYYDPAFVEAIPTRNLAVALYHEVCHLLREHPDRMDVFPEEVAQLAADAEINDDIRREFPKGLPLDPVFPETFGLPEGRLAEFYAAALLERARREAASGSSGTPEGAGGSPDRPEAGAGASVSDVSGADRNAGASAGAGATRPEAGGGRDRGSGTGADRGAGASAGTSGAGTDREAGTYRPKAGSPRSHEAPRGPGEAPGDPNAGASARGPVGRLPGAAGGRCGSCATGRPEPWEAPPPSEPNAPPGINSAEAEIIRRQVAQEIIRIASASRDRGTIPGQWLRWAEACLRPKVDWRRALASAVRRAVEIASGAADYSFLRPSRRQTAYDPFFFPGRIDPVPRVAVVIDTSGSVSDEQLGRAVAEVGGVLRALGLRQSVTVLAVDAAVQAVSRVFRPEQVRLAGGGGTDMRVGIEAALRLRPRPQAVVVLTDGYTPWPDSPPRDAGVVVGLIGDGKAPEWATTVRIPEEDDREMRR
jgi:predicted metal-dependent peptidase